MAKRPQQPEPAAPPTATPGARVTMESLGIASSSTGADKPRLNRSPAFLYFIHPERWMVSEGQVVPALKRQPLINGVNAITQRADGKYELGKLLEVQKKKGWTMLDPMVDGVEAYLYQPIEGVWLSRWETAHAGSSVVTSNARGYVAWLRGLIAAEKIEAPRPYVLSALLATLRSEAARLQDQVRTVPSVQVDLDAKLVAITVVERELGGAPLIPVSKDTTTNPLGDLVVTEE